MVHFNHKQEIPK